MRIAASSYRKHITPYPHLFYVGLLNMDRALQKFVKLVTGCQNHQMWLIDDSKLCHGLINRLPYIIADCLNDIAFHGSVTQS